MTPEMPGITQLHDRSGLTWEQLARMFGVSRRALHHWADGGRMTAAQQDLAVRLLRTVDSLGAADPAEARTALLAVDDSTGRSQVDRVRARQGSQRFRRLNSVRLRPSEAVAGL